MKGRTPGSSRSWWSETKEREPSEEYPEPIFLPTSPDHSINPWWFPVRRVLVRFESCAEEWYELGWSEWCAFVSDRLRNLPLDLSRLRRAERRTARIATLGNNLWLNVRVPRGTIIKHCHLPVLNWQLEAEEIRRRNLRERFLAEEHEKRGAHPRFLAEEHEKRGAHP